MSGDGLILLLALPVMVGAAAVIGTGIVGYGAIRAIGMAGKAAYNYAKKKKQEQEDAIRNSGILQGINRLHADMGSTFTSLDAMGDQTFENITEIQQSSFEELEKLVQAGNVEAVQDFMRSAGKFQAAMQKKIDEEQKNFERNYTAKADQAILKMRTESEERTRDLTKKIKAVENDLDAMEELYRTEAKKAIEEAESLLDALVQVFEMEHLAPGLYENLSNQLNDCRDLYEKGIYESALASAVDLKMVLGEKAFDLKKADIEWNNAYMSALQAAELMKNYLESQQCFSEEAGKYMQEHYDITLPEELKEEELAEFADLTEDGKNMFVQLSEQAGKILKMLDGTAGKNMSAKQLEKQADWLLEAGMPAAYQTVNNAILNMSNSFYRAGKAQKFAAFLKTKELTVHAIGYRDEDNRTSPIDIIVRNPFTGERVVYSLAKQQQGQSPAQVTIEYRMAGKIGPAGEEHEIGEARNKYYQGLISEFYGEKLNINCKASTIGHVAANIPEEIREKLPKV